MKKLLLISLPLMFSLSVTAQAKNNVQFSCHFKNYTKQPMLIAVKHDRKAICTLGARNIKSLNTAKLTGMWSGTCGFVPNSNTTYKVTVMRRGQSKGESITLPTGNIGQVKNIDLRYITKTWGMTCRYSNSHQRAS